MAGLYRIGELCDGPLEVTSPVQPGASIGLLCGPCGLHRPPMANSFEIGAIGGGRLVAGTHFAVQPYVDGTDAT